MASNHRSTSEYVSVWRKEHILRGHEWSEQLTVLCRDLKRAASRGLGPARRAEAFSAEELSRLPRLTEGPVSKGGPLFPHVMVAVGTAWLLRGAEIAALLGEQASIDRAKKEATLHLCATKSDVGGSGCARTLRCLCDSEVLGPCPFCSLASLLEQRAGKNLGPKQALFPAAGGRAASSRASSDSTSLLLSTAPPAGEESVSLGRSPWMMA